MNLLLAFLAFDVIVFVHELGHFLFAKLFKIKVLEFSMFMGPKLYSWQRGETTYSIRLIPIMAYVKMEGEDEASDSENAFNKQPVYARALTCFGGPFANLLLAAILLPIFFSVTGYSTTHIDQVELNSAASAAGLRSGDVILKYADKSIYQPIDLVQFVYVGKGTKSEIVVLRDGEKISAEITPKTIPEGTSYKLGVSFNTETGADSNVVQAVSEGYPAKVAGILAGDRIIQLGDIQTANYKEIKSTLDASAGKEMKVVIDRNGSQMTMNLVPKAEKIAEQYETGIELAYEKGSIGGAIKQSFGYTWSIIRSVVYSLEWLITGQVPVKQMMGPIGMVSTIGTVVQQGQNIGEKLLYLAHISAFLSIAVGATNLIPFPALDGSKLLLLAIEAIRRKPIPIEKEAFITMVGFVVIILFAIYVAYNDIVRLVTG